MEGSNFRQQQPRRTKAYVSLVGTSQLYLRNPLVIAAWSIAFPGLGHILLSKYSRGFLIFILEVVINLKAHINILILYSFLGDFEKAKSIVDIRWLMLYIPVYVFTIWDSYRTTIDMNNVYKLAAREDAEIKIFKINALEINYLDKKSPWAAALWSLLLPGSGEMYIHRVVTAAFVMVFWIVIVIYSRLLPGLHNTMLGNFQAAKSVLDPHWTLNITSIYIFSMYDAYMNAVENDKLFDWEQSKFLKREYENKNFQIPFDMKGNKGDAMYIVSTFEHSIHLEMAITAIQMKGIKKEDILAVPLDKRGEERNLFDSVHYSDGLSLIDLAAILATFFGIFGSIYGFVLKWGPLFWGLIGIFTGGLLGISIKLITTKKFSNRRWNRTAAEVVLIIKCKEDQSEIVKETLWSHSATGVRKLDMGKENC